MHEVAIAHPLLALAADLALVALEVASGDKRRTSLAEVIDEILNDRARLGQHHGLGSIGGLDGDDGRLAQWVHFLQLGGRKLVGAALESLEFIFQLQLLQQPENAVAARLLEPGAN